MSTKQAGAYTHNPANLARESASVDQHSVVGRSK